MDKDADAYRTISEVAQALDIPPHVLRFWETRFPQIKPLKRGGGRRYYRRSDTDLLRMVRRLLYEEGYTIRGVQRLLKSQGSARAAAPAAGEPSTEEDRLPAASASTGADVSGADATGLKGRQVTVEALLREIAACRATLDAALQGPESRPSA